MLALEKAPSLTIDERWDADVAIATVRGEIDIETVATLSEHLGHLAGKNPQRLIIDLARVSFIDSSGLSGFVRIRAANALRIATCCFIAVTSCGVTVGNVIVTDRFGSLSICERRTAI